MSCCGKQREHFLGASQTPQSVAVRKNQPLSLPSIPFEYVGATGLTVQGAVTGKRYRFDSPGSRVLIAPQDVPSMIAVPRLRRV